MIVPERPVISGLDSKFDADPNVVDLSLIKISPERYHAIVSEINERLRPIRPDSFDVACLATGMAMVPLAIWGIRNSGRTRKRKEILLNFIEEFNDRTIAGEEDGTSVVLKWNKRKVVSGEPYLSIERLPTKLVGRGEDAMC